MTDTINTNLEAEKVKVQSKTSKPLLYIAIASIVMLFAGFTSAYIVRQAEGNWLEFDLPSIFYVSTAIILASSATMWYANLAASKNNYKGVTLGVVATLVLGVAFAISQFEAWGDLVDSGIFFTGQSANASGSFLYILSGMHLAHLGGGLIALLIVLVNSLKNKYSSENKLGLELCSTYWHFLDVLWIYLLLFLLFIR